MKTAICATGVWQLENFFAKSSHIAEVPDPETT
jgi:hypothetical protein